MKFIQLLSLTLLLVTSSAFANIEDLQIVSQEQDLNFKKNTMYFKGNVVIVQGEMTISADELFVITKDGNGEKLVAKGQPATFTQANPSGENLEATATEIIYMVNERVLELKGAAKYRQGGSYVDSDNGNITFDLDSQRVKAVGDTENGGRVTTTIKIKPKGSGDN